MTPLHEDPCSTFQFADDRIVSRSHLNGINAGQQVSAQEIDPGTQERLGLLATGIVGDGDGMDLSSRLSSEKMKYLSSSTGRYTELRRYVPYLNESPALSDPDLRQIGSSTLTSLW